MVFDLGVYPVHARLRVSGWAGSVRVITKIRRGVV